MKGIAGALAVAAVAVVIGGCGGGNDTSTAVTGVVADGYLVDALGFLDRNGNYRWDEGEPKTFSGEGGVYSLRVPAEDAGKYPVVVSVLAGRTVDEDTGQPVTAGYVLSAPPRMPS